MDVVAEYIILDYQPEHQPWFENLNREWIEKYFGMEPIDFDVLQHPEEYIIKPGGHILMIQCDREIAGTVALKYVSKGVYEFTKMSVAEKFRGQKIGKALAQAAIAKAGLLGAHKIILYSSTKLAAAISLYRKLKFVEVPVDGPYKRSDIKMELVLVSADTKKNAAFTIRRATEADASMLCEIGVQTFRDSFEALNTPANMRMYLDKTFSVEKMQAEISEPGAIFLIAYDKEAIAGYVKMREGHDPDNLNESNAVEIERLYATRDYIGKGTGSYLMNTALEYAREKQFDTVWLGVWEHNLRAIQFYEKMGFGKFGSHVFMLGTDPQTDLLMKKKIKNR